MMSAQLSAQSGWRAALFNRRMLICVFTGFSSGLPLYILLSLLPAWLRSEHVDLRAIGLFALMQFPFNWKFLWSPLLDRYALPAFGRRRGWMLASQIALLLALPAFGALDPQFDLLTIALLAMTRCLSQRDPGHRARCLPARNSCRHRTRSRQFHSRQRVPHRRPRAGIAVADTRGHSAVVERVRHHRALHAAGHRHDARGERAGGRRRAAANAARRGRRAVPRIHLARRPALGTPDARIHGALQARRQHGHGAGDAVLPRHGIHQDRDRTHRQACRPVAQRDRRAARRHLDVEARHQSRVVAVRRRAGSIDTRLRAA